MTINGLIVPDYINYMSIHAAASVFPLLLPGKGFRVFLSPALTQPREILQQMHCNIKPPRLQVVYFSGPATSFENGGTYCSLLVGSYCGINSVRCVLFLFC